MKQVTNEQFYAFVETIKAARDRKPHLKVVPGGVEMHYIINPKKENKTVAVVKNINRNISYFLV